MRSFVNFRPSFIALNSSSHYPWIQSSPVIEFQGFNPVDGECSQCIPLGGVGASILASWAGGPFWRMYIGMPCITEVNIRCEGWVHRYYIREVVIGFRLDHHRDVIRSLSNPSWDNMRVGAADVPVRIVLMTKTEHNLMTSLWGQRVPPWKN